MSDKGTERVADESGPAFPAPLMEGGFRAGLTRRDWLAGQALIGLLANSSGSGQYRPDEAADMAYQYADAMLARRAKG